MNLKNEPDEKQWICLYCTIFNNSLMFPFTGEPDDVLLALNDIDLPSIIADFLPSFEISSKLTNLPNLADYDTDENMSLSISSQYSTVQEIASMEVSKKDLSFFHMNIRSLPLHFDELHALLSCLKIDFHVIGLSEIKTSTDAQFRSNIELPGYNFHHTPSLSSAGGVGSYVKSNLTANKRDDLCVSDIDFETVWVEIDNTKAKNILCCCVYRHPSSSIQKFNDHLQEILSNPANAHKLTIIMGDFNIDLLKSDNDAPTNDFINMMSSYHFQPTILHPTRISDTSSTLIDNVYINNAMDSNICSGNILSLISDHLPQFAILNGSTPDYKKTSYTAYDYRNFDASKFLADYVNLESFFSMIQILV